MSKVEKIKSGNKNIYCVDKKYIIKNASKEILKAEKFFLEKYSNLQMEKIIKSNIEENYMIYSYIDGTIINKIEDVKECLNMVYSITKEYVEVDVNGFGDIFNLKKSWEEFLKQEIDLKSKYITCRYADLENIVYEKIKIIGKKKIEKKLIHGDLGSFNIICKNKRIEGIIDPRTVVGEPLYDFIYFICSNHNITNAIDLEEILEILNNEDKEKIFAYLYILLYDRICIEQKNRTGNEKDFYEFFKKVKAIESKVIYIKNNSNI